MLSKILQKAFEAGVKAAIEIFKKGPISPKTLAEAAEKVSKAVAKAGKHTKI